jgi:hypothetical protein
LLIRLALPSRMTNPEASVAPRFVTLFSVVSPEPGVSIAVPTNRVHAVRVVGDRPLVTFSIHASGKRIVNYLEPPIGASFPSPYRPFWGSAERVTPNTSPRLRGEGEER